ncbi:amino acid ABC transporter substrate-binding protein [Microvirga lotononidis]|uniref:Periplasmic component of amino acid ABC-type transporter/signal transduction system n=1 Tax=Microvirga lotononidis TaxID=864069 RepID=I4YU79_9HYPH|nr:amino acid ABC transporter substrate-binding protein [Microvirga lotononidis]EIM27521.1 periplasmic component of amino acid ABC-type transporter/signal transduction system [Microvirga lotononidis]WQO28328.1 amino acid ABC transporter substrate-binding protein [Microvirga lotononidis]
MLSAAQTFLFAGLMTVLAVPAGAGTLESVKQRGTLQCGVSDGLFGFSERNDQGEWSGFDVDFCRAVAGAVFRDRAKVTFVPLSAGERFDALRTGRVDLLSRNSTWTLEREAGLGLAFAGITYHDGQGFMVMRDRAVASALELDRAKVCVETGTTSQLNLADFFRANSMTFEERAFPSAAEALAAFQSGQCNVLTRDQSALFAERLKLRRASDAVILPDIISKEPLGPVTRADDFAWFTIVKWVNFALVNAEELGISSANADETAKSHKPDVRRFAGLEGESGRMLGLEGTWALDAVRAAGNYAEIYERNLGVESRLGIPRGLNQLWSMGGILYAPPVR